MSTVFEITYDSYNEYEHPVKEAFFEFLISPCNNDLQSVLEFNIKNSSSLDVFTSKNSFGFTLIRIRPAGYFNSFNLKYSAKVKSTAADSTDNLRLTSHEQWAEINSINFYIENFLFLSHTPLTFLSKENSGDILLYHRSSDLLDYFLQLNHHIHKLITYEKDRTNVNTTASEVMNIKYGVCQDFTHLFLAMAKHNGLASRYVSGYIDQGSSFIGSAMMHAWAEVYIPGMGWTGFDPTNNRRTNNQYIKVCHGRDYSDCCPIKGILHTFGENKTYHQVQVTQQ